MMIRTINTASIGLTVPMEAVDKGEDEIIVYIEAVEGVYTKETNDMEETREQDFSRRDAMFVIN